MQAMIAFTSWAQPWKIPLRCIQCLVDRSPADLGPVERPRGTVRRFKTREEANVGEHSGQIDETERHRCLLYVSRKAQEAALVHDATSNHGMRRNLVCCYRECRLCRV